MTEHVNPSEIWQQEDENFSSWLGKNLNLLDKILSTQLDLERPVGPFFADLLCRNRVDDSLIIIKNQLERTDHKHLGQLLTYATELQAQTIIWIATEFENEHRNILDWLNDNMNDRFRFFGVELELRSIDNLRCEPKFTLITEPRNTNRQRFDNHSSNNDDNHSHLQFWSAFRDYLSGRESSLNPWEWNKDNDYFGFHIGNLEDIWFVAWRNNKGTQIAVKLCLKGENAESYFDRLKAQQQSIEAEFGQQLQWDKNPAYSPFPQTGLYNLHVAIDKADWPNQFEWLCRTLEKLDAVFRTRISECTRKDYRSPTIAEPRNKSYQEENNSYLPINIGNNLAQRYWSEFQKYCNDKDMSLVPLPPELNDDNYYGFHIKGVPNGISWLAAWRNNIGTKIAVNLHLRLTENVPQNIVEEIKNIDALEAFDTLVKQKELIEASFGGSLTWNKHPTFPALGPLVGLYWQPTSTDESDWNFQFKWMRQNLEKLNKIFRPFIQDIISLV